jgi:hypothetical protein
MIENEVILTTNHSNMPTFAACPEGLGLYPEIIFYVTRPASARNCETWRGASLRAQGPQNSSNFHRLSWIR